MQMTGQRAYFPYADLAEAAQVSFSWPALVSHATFAAMKSASALAIRLDHGLATRSRPPSVSQSIRAD